MENTKTSISIKKHSIGDSAVSGLFNGLQGGAAMALVIVLFSLLAGLIYGAWVDGASVWLIGLCLVVVVGLVALGLYQVNKRNLQKAVGPPAAIPEER